MSYPVLLASIPNWLAEDINDELAEAESKFPPINSGHEGYAVILEELDEAWEAIRSKDATRAEIRAELVQVAAMAIRTIKDWTDATGEAPG